MIEDPDGLVGVQSRFRVETQFTQDLYVLGIPNLPQCLCESKPESVQQRPVDFPCLFQTREIGYVLVSMPPQDFLVRLRAQNAPDAAETRSHVPVRQARGSGIPRPVCPSILSR